LYMELIVREFVPSEGRLTGRAWGVRFELPCLLRGGGLGLVGMVIGVPGGVFSEEGMRGLMGFPCEFQDVTVKVPVKWRVNAPTEATGEEGVLDKRGVERS